MSEFEKIVQRIRDFRDLRDWKQFHNPKDIAISLVLEAAEVLEHFQWKNKEETEAHIRDHKEDIEDELADVFIYLVQTCDVLGVDIIQASRRKYDKNEKKYPVEKAKGRHTKYTKL